jgi:hypothetical protein
VPRSRMTPGEARKLEGWGQALGSSAGEWAVVAGMLSGLGRQSAESDTP